MSAVAVGRLVYGLAALWAVGFSALAAARYTLFLDRRYDLGNFTQAIWTTAHGHFLEITEVGGEQVSRLGIHVDPILVLFVPLWWVFPSPVLLVVVQGLALASGALPLFWLARAHLDRERDAAIVAVAYLLCPAVCLNALSEFHPVALAVPFLLLSIWFLDQGRLWGFWASAGAAILCQEQVGLIIGCLGLWFMWRRRQVLPGVFIVLGGTIASVFAFAVVLPHFSSASPYQARYAAVGGGFTGIIRTAVTDPAAILNSVHLWDLVSLAVVVTPVLGLCFRSSLMLASAPQIALLVLSGRQADWQAGSQNLLLLVPFVYAGAVYGLERSGRSHSRRRGTVLIGFVLLASLALALTRGPFNLQASQPSSARQGESKSKLQAQRYAVGLVPAHARVAATNHLGSHLAARRYVYVFPVVNRADWIVMDTADNYLPDLGFLRRRKDIEVGVRDLYWQPKLMARELRMLERSPVWRSVYTSSTIHVFKRRSVRAT